LNRAHFFPEAYPDTINDMDKQTRDFINNNNKLTNYVIQESKQGDRKLHELMQLYRINISEQEAHTVTDHSHDMQEISNSAELFMKKPVDVSAYWAGIITGIVGMAFCAAIFIICITFLHFDFLKSPFWWCLFFLAGLSIFLESFGTREMPYNKDAARAWARAGLKGYGGPGPIMLALGKVIGPITIILAFIFFWWQGGVAIIISCIIWFFFVFSLLNLIVHASTFTPSDNPNDR